MSDLAQAVPWIRDEAELVTELQARSDAAFDWLFNFFPATLYNLVFRILGGGASPADFTQEVFLKVFRGIRGFRRGSSLKTWLYRIAVREALNHRRWCWRHLRQLISLDGEPPEGRPAMELPDLERTPFESFAAGEVQAVIRRGLAAVQERFGGARILTDVA